MDEAAVLEIKHLTKMFHSVAALDDVSLLALPAAIHVLLGEDGAGKTTLLKVLGGLIPASAYEGEILVEGQPVSIRTPLDSFRHGMAVVPRGLGVFPSMSVLDNIMVGHRPGDRSLLSGSRAARQRAEQALRRAGLNLALDVNVDRLSTAQQRQLMLGRALSTDPRLIVLDEPSAFSSGPGELGQLMRTLRDLAGQNLALLYLTRVPEEAMQIGDRITILRDGALVGSYERADFDLTTLVMAMRSQHPERSPGPEDGEEPDGLLGSLRSIFGFGKRS
jgi:ribose transport system ATP-binding protein